jgi:DEAD/DEAH box helicase domain-containing protein
LDWAARRAELEPCSDDTYTVPIMSGVVEPGAELDRQSVGPFEVSLWTVQVTSTAIGYRVVSMQTRETLATEELQSPTMTLNTVAVRWDLPMSDNFEDLPIVATHTLEHGLVALAPLLTGAQPSELGSAWYALASDSMRPCVWVYDNAEGGAGLAESLLRQAAEWLRGVRELAEKCGCIDGCPLCVMNSRCEARNEMISRAALLSLVPDQV